MVQFTAEEREELQQLIDSDYWKLLRKVVSHAVSVKEQALLEYRGADPAHDGARLVHLSAQLEGARSVSALLDSMERTEKKRRKNG